LPRRPNRACRIARLVSGPTTWARTGGDARRLEKLGSLWKLRSLREIAVQFSTPPCDPGEEQPGRKQRRRKLCVATATRPPSASPGRGTASRRRSRPRGRPADMPYCKQSSALCLVLSNAVFDRHLPALPAICRCPNSVKEVILATKPPGS